MEVGQKLFFIKRDGNIDEVTISKIGHKYFYVNGNWELENKGFELDTLEYVNKMYSQFNIQLYPSKQVIEEKWEREELRGEVDKFFYTHQYRTLSTQQLRDIKSIIYAVQKS